MGTKNTRAYENGTNLTATTLIELRRIDRGHAERLIRSAGRRPSVPFNDLRGHFFTAK